MHFTFNSTHLNLDVQSSLEMLELYFDFITFTAEKADSHVQVIPNALKFPKNQTENLVLNLNLNEIKSELEFLSPTSHISSVQHFVVSGYQNQTGLRCLLSKLCHTKSFFLIIRRYEGSHWTKA